MKIKVNKHKLKIHYWGSPWGSRTQQHAYCLRYAHSHHIESHLGKKQPQAKIAIAFLFGHLHFNNVTSHALFYGDHLVMRSKRCAMQNQGVTLNPAFLTPPPTVGTPSQQGPKRKRRRIQFVNYLPWVIIKLMPNNWGNVGIRNSNLTSTPWAKKMKIN